MPRSIGSHRPLAMVEGVSVSNIQHQVFQQQAQIQQQQHSQQREHAPLPPKHPMYQMPHQTPSLAVLTPFPNTSTSIHTSSSSACSSPAPFLPFSEKTGLSLNNEAVSVAKPNHMAQQYLYIAQATMTSGRSTSPPESSTALGEEPSSVRRILDNEEGRHSEMMEILQHQQPHHQVFLQQNQSHFLVSDHIHQQFHQQNRPFQDQFQGTSESPSPSIASAPPPSSSQSNQQRLQKRKQQQEEDFEQQEAELSKLKDLFEQNDLNKLGTRSEEESMLFQAMPPSRPVIKTRGRSRTLPGRSSYPETSGKPHLHFHLNHYQQQQQQQVEAQQVQVQQDALFDSTTLDDFLTSSQSQSAQESLEVLKTVSSLSLDVLNHPFMMDPSTTLFAPGSSASPPPSWLLESDLGVGLVDDPDDEEAENDIADDRSSAQADESGTTAKGVRHVGGRAIGGSRPNSLKSPKYECPLCNRFYTRPFNLRSHMLVHEDKKPFACELCDSRFTRRHDMVRHVKTRHKNQQPDVVGEGTNGGGPAPADVTGSSEGRDGGVRDTLEDLQ